MPAGDLITQDNQAEIRGLLLGEGSSYQIRRGGLEGFEDQVAKTADLDLLGDGVWFGIDRLAALDRVIGLRVRHSTQAGLQTLIDAFKTAWALGGDEQFHWQRGGVHRYVVGRTRHLDVDETKRHLLVVEIDAQLVFNPAITVVP